MMRSLIASCAVSRSDTARFRRRVGLFGSRRLIMSFSQLAGDTLADRLDMRAHCGFGAILVVRLHRGKNRLVLLLEADLLRRGERDEPEPQRALAQLAQNLGELV